ncbi:IS1 family transposase, partial [Escherichia coli]|uniref:IS1 family transposase n=1 Tax=Escherichia coli TaxID=562 RepID=UPI001E31EC88
KFGLAPLGCGWVIWRDEEALPQELVFNVDYLGGQIGTFAINFSRPAGQVIAQYYEFLRLGREGYTKVQNASYQVAAYLADEIAKLGPYEFICTGRPDEGIPAVARLGRKSLSFSKSVELHDKVIGHYLNIKHYQ